MKHIFSIIELNRFSPATTNSIAAGQKIFNASRQSHIPSDKTFRSYAPDGIDYCQFEYALDAHDHIRIHDHIRKCCTVHNRMASNIIQREN
jgi:hypothetical protein